MKVIEQSANRLAFRIGLANFNATECDFDPFKGRARIERVIFFWRCKPLDFELDAISDAYLARMDNSRNSHEVYPVLRLKSGATFSFPAGMEAASKWAVSSINAFLKP
jgi:hypothetical protein